MIKLIWLGIVCCGIANAVIYSQVASPKKYLYIGLLLLVCLIFVIIHRYITKDLINEDKDYDEDYSPIFIKSTVIVIIASTIAVVTGFIATAVGLYTAEFGFALATIRESRYV